MLFAEILHNDSLTRSLDDPEARMLVEWLCEHSDGSDIPVKRYRRARVIAQFVALWCYEPTPNAALQLAATERLGWPLPTSAIDPCELMAGILAWESRDVA